MSIPMLFQALETILTTEVYIKSSSIPLTIYVSSATCLLSLIAGIIIVK